MVLSYDENKAVVIDDEKIKVPEAFVVAYGTAQEMQEMFGVLTEQAYVYDFADQTAGNGSTQIAGDGSTQTAGDESTQTAGNGSTCIIRGTSGYLNVLSGQVVLVVHYYNSIYTKVVKMGSYKWYLYYQGILLEEEEK